MLTDAALEFLSALLDAPGPSGFETLPARRWRAFAEGIADEVRTDVTGNSFATLKGGEADAPTVMLAGHIDEIGLRCSSASGSPSSDAGGRSPA